MRHASLYLRASELISSKASQAVFVKILAAVASYASLAVIATQLDKDSFGVFSFALGLLGFLGALATLGMQNGVIRFLSQYRAQSEPGYQHGLIVSVWRFGTIATIAIALLAAIGILALWQAGVSVARDPQYLLLAVLLLPGFSVLEINSAIGRSYGSIWLALAPRDVVWRLALIPLVFLATIHFAEPQATFIAFLGGAVACLLALVALQWLLVRRFVPQMVWQQPARNDFPLWKRTCGPLWINSIAATTFRSLDVVLLGLFISPELLGGYFLASRATMLVDFVHTSINAVFGPRIARAFHAGGGEPLSAALRQVVILASMPAVLVMVLLVAFGGPLMAFFGYEDEVYHTVLIALAAGRLISALCGSSNVLMNVSGHERPALRQLLTTGVPGLLAVGVLAPLAGMLGTAIAVATTQAVLNLRQVIYAKRTIGYDPSIMSAFPAAYRVANSAFHPNRKPDQ